MGLIDESWSLSRRFDFSGQSVAWDAFGDGPPVILVHGTPFSSYVWRTIARELARHTRVYLYDLLGYGQSEMRAGQDVSLGVQNELFAALLAIGASPRRMSSRMISAVRRSCAPICLMAAIITKLLLIDPVAIRPWGSPFVQHVRQHEAAFAGVPDYLQRAILPPTSEARSAGR